jgi:plasmanylethanolamine desaturase
MKAKIVQRDATVLADGYTPFQRRLNLFGCGLFCITFPAVLYTLWAVTTGAEWFLVAGAALLGVIIADFGSGLLHWAADTWGHADLPIVGRMFIRSFREHHIVQSKICEHGWVQANGEATLLSNFLWGGMLFFAPAAGQGVFLAMWTTFGATILLLVLTNEFHKWAHIKHPAKPIQLLQRVGLLQSYKRHAYHHATPFTKSYCITTGWLNTPLDAIGFWRFAERSIHRITGFVPREDDIGRDAAVALWNNLNAGRRGFPLPLGDTVDAP